MRRLLLLLLLAATSVVAACGKPSVDDRLTAFLAAWQRSDFTGLALRTPQGQPLDAAAAKQLLADTEGELAGRRPKLTRLGKASVHASDALARVGVAWPLPDGRTWTYETTVNARQIDDAWQIYFDAATVHPDLHPGQRLTLQRSGAPRGTILAADGTPIVSEVPVVYVGLEPQYVNAAKRQREPATRPPEAATRRHNPAGRRHRAGDGAPRAGPAMSRRCR